MMNDPEEDDRDWFDALWDGFVSPSLTVMVGCVALAVAALCILFIVSCWRAGYWMLYQM